MRSQRFAQVSLVCSLATAMLCAQPLSAQNTATQPAPSPSPAAAPSNASAAQASSPAPMDPAWAGAWTGAARLNAPAGAPGAELPIVVVVRGGAAGPSVEVSSLPAGAVHKAAVDVAADGRKLAFTLDSGGRKARFEGELAEDGSPSGTLVFLGDPRGASAPTAKWSLRRVDLVSEVKDARVFTATLDAGAQKLPMRLALGEGVHGWCGALDILVQGVRDFPVEVARTDTGFTVRLPAGLAASIELAPKDGVKSLAEMKVLEGTFRQGAFSAPIRFELAANAVAGTLRRPQDPAPPFPYESREVKVRHPRGHELAGTLLLPKSSALAVDGRVPGIVFVTGSGAQNRDEELMGHRPFAVLADALTRAGFATLRLDDRGFGASTGDFASATTFDFASDADMAVEWMKREQGIDAARVGLLGHSEGGLVGPVVAAWQNGGDAPSSPLSFLILIAPPGEPGGRILTEQTKALLLASGMSAEKIEPMLAAHRALMAEVRARRSADELRPTAKALVRSQLELAQQAVPPDEGLVQLVEQTVAQVSSPWMSEFIRTDPRTAIDWIEVPTLAVWGTKDLQVDASLNRVAFDAAKAAGAPVTLQVFDGLNHLMQPAVKGTVEEYGEIDTTIDPAALEAIVSWAVETAKRGPLPQVPEASRPQSVRDNPVPARLAIYRDAPAAPAASAPTAANPAEKGGM